jgi:hypothetical protein
MEPPATGGSTTAKQQLRRSLRSTAVNTARLAECGHDQMHVDPSTDRDLKCDMCWQHRETLIRRLLEPFERALAVVAAEEEEEGRGELEGKKGVKRGADGRDRKDRRKREGVVVEVGVDEGDSPPLGDTISVGSSPVSVTRRRSTASSPRQISTSQSPKSVTLSARPKNKQQQAATQRSSNGAVAAVGSPHVVSKSPVDSAAPKQTGDKLQQRSIISFFGPSNNNNIRVSHTTRPRSESPEKKEVSLQSTDERWTRRAKMRKIKPEEEPRKEDPNRRKSSRSLVAVKKVNYYESSDSEVNFD